MIHPVNRLPRWWPVLTLGVPAAAWAIMYAAPMTTLVRRVIGGDTVRRAFAADGLADTLRFTLLQAAISTLATMLLGLLPTWLIARRQVRGRRLLLAACVVPFFLPTVVVGAAISATLPDAFVGSTLAIVVAHVYLNIAVVVRVVGPAWSAVPTDLHFAAATLGASPAATARTITLPLLRTALTSAAAVIFAFTFTSFGVIVVLGSSRHPTLEMEIARRATQLGDVGVAAVLSLLQVAALAAVVWISGRSRTVDASGPGSLDNPARSMAGSTNRSTTGAAALIVFVMSLPMAIMIVRSLRIGQTWTIAGWRVVLGLERGPTLDRPGLQLGVDLTSSLGASLRLAVVAAALATAVSALACAGITRSRRLGRLLDGALALPLGTSSVTLGLGMLITFDTGAIDWRGSWWLIAAGHAMIAVPLCVRAVVPVLRTIPDDLRLAAGALGASPLRAWWHVDGRVMLRPLATSAAIAAALSLGEFGATSVLSRSGDDTMPLAIARLLGRTGELPRAAAFAGATVLMLVVGIIVTLADPALTRQVRTDRGGRR